MARTTAARVGLLLGLPACAASIDLAEHARIVAEERATCDRQTKSLDAARLAAERERDEILLARERDERDAAGRVDALSAALAERDRRSRHAEPSDAPVIALQPVQARFVAAGLSAEVRGSRLVATIPADSLFGSPGGVQLTAEGRALIPIWIRVVGPDSGLSMSVHVYSDDAADDEAAESFQLTGRRALEIVRALLDAGWPPSRLTLAGHGRHRPRDPAPTEAARQANRRVELWIE